MEIRTVVALMLHSNVAPCPLGCGRVVGTMSVGLLAESNFGKNDCFMICHYDFYDRDPNRTGFD